MMFPRQLQTRRGFILYTKGACILTALVILLGAYMTFMVNRLAFFGEIKRVMLENNVLIRVKRSSRDVDTFVDPKRNFSQLTDIEVPEINLPITSIMDNPYLINNDQMCSGLDNLLFVVIVHSSTVDFLRRTSIRETWANYQLFRNDTMRVVFLLGRPGTERVQKLIDHERDLYNDIVQGDFTDTYHKLTLKAMLGLRWVTEFCPVAKFVLKVDDDVFVNVFRLIELLEHGPFPNAQRQIWCQAKVNGTSMIMRHDGKWMIPDEEFKNMTHWPFTHCNGFFMLYTGPLVPELFQASKTTDVLWLDDVYVSGVLAEAVGKVRRVQMQHLNTVEEEALACFDSDARKCPILAANVRAWGLVEKLWLRTLVQYKDLVKKHYQRQTPEYFDYIIE